MKRKFEKMYGTAKNMLTSYFDEHICGGSGMVVLTTYVAGVIRSRHVIRNEKSTTKTLLCLMSFNIISLLSIYDCGLYLQMTAHHILCSNIWYLATWTSCSDTVTRWYNRERLDKGQTPSDESVQPLPTIILDLSGSHM